MAVYVLNTCCSVLDAYVSMIFRIFVDFLTLNISSSPAAFRNLRLIGSLDKSGFTSAILTKKRTRLPFTPRSHASANGETTSVRVLSRGAVRLLLS